MEQQPAIIFTTRQSQEFGKEIAKFLQEPFSFGKINFQTFSDGEYQPAFEETVRGARVFIIGSTMPPADNLMELLLLCDAAKRASAKSVTVVMPYFGWARQDRKDKPRVPIAAKMVANILTSAGATRVMTMDLHADQIQGFFEIPVDHIYASTIFIEYIKTLNLNNLCIASPDMGGAKRARNYAKYLDADVVVCYKERSKANQIGYMDLIGNVEGKNVILIDDMIDTAGTISQAADLLKERGALSVRCFATHAILSGKAYEKIQNSKMEELVVTDTIPLKNSSLSKIKVLTCAPLFAEVMKLVHNQSSISSKFII